MDHAQDAGELPGHARQLRAYVLRLLQAGVLLAIAVTALFVLVFPRVEAGNRELRYRATR